MLRSSVVWVSVLLLCLVLAQSNPEEIHHHNVTFGVGPAIPLGNARNYLSTAPLIRLGYGYRFNRLFQGDFGFQMAFGAAHNQNPEATDLGQVQGGDHEFMIPLGGRIYIPQPLHRTEVSVGAGGLYLHYSETAPSIGYRPGGRLPAFAKSLSLLVGREVVDKTGLTGKFALHLEFAIDDTLAGLPNPLGPALSDQPTDPARASIRTALQEQLGLKLDVSKGPVDVLVIDHVERPTEN